MNEPATPAEVGSSDQLGGSALARAGLRGFGVTITPGGARNWYAGSDGVRRWASNDQPCDPPPPRGCYECAWGKVLGCWRCGSR